MATVNGTASNDTLSGTSGDDTINGLEGNDLFLAGSTGGNDVINGGAGRDSIEFKSRATSAIMVDFAAGTITGGSSGTITFTSIERVLTGDFNDTLIGNAAGQTLSGQGGSDTISGAGGVDTLWGGTAADSFVFRETGTANADHISDFASASDKIVLDATVMSALGASGNFAASDARFVANSTGTAQDASDRIIYETDTREVWYDPDGTGSAARQLIATLQVGATLVATDVVVEGSSGPAPIVGTEGDDTIRGTSADDVIEGGGGHDFLEGALGADTVFGGAGNDHLYSAFYGSFDDTAGNRLFGGDGHDALGGGSGDDYLQGDTGDDYMWGYLGADTLAGGYGRDTLTGQGYGDGADVLLFDVAPDILNVDSVHYFETGTDKIHLDARVMPGVGASGTLSFNDARFAVGTREGRDADDRITWDGSALYYDADGSGSTPAQYIAIFGGNGVPAELVATDIVIINGNPGSTTTGTSDADSLAGTAGDDTLQGFGGNDTLSGLSGGDRLDGGDGADHLMGGEGSDTLIGGNGADTLDGGTGDDWYFGLTAGDSITDAGGRDSWVQIFGFDAFMEETVEDLYLAPEAGAVDGTGGSGANYIGGNASDNQLNGMGGSDTLYGGIGDDTLLGGSGADSLSGSDGADVLNGGAGRDSLAGGAGADLFVFDLAPGDADADSIYGFDSWADTIQLDAAAMPALGASGNFSDFDARFYAARGATGGHDADDRIVFDQTSGSLYYDPDGSGAAAAQLIARSVSTFDYVAARDILVVNGGASGLAIDGTSGNDLLSGTSFDDTMNGLAGNDTLLGAEGNDVIDGGDGNDILRGEAGDDTLIGGAGDDTLDGSANDRLLGGDGNDLLGSALDVDGGAGVDTIMVSGAADLGAGTISAGGQTGTITSIENAEAVWYASALITGSAGANFLRGGNGGDTLDGAGGNDTIRGSLGNDTLAGGDGNDALWGEYGNDTLAGGEGDDTLLGASENDSLHGGSGADLLDGGEGEDTLTGGAGADTLLLNTSPNSGVETVTDFASGVDTLRLDGHAFAEIGVSGEFSAADGRFHAAAGATQGHDADDRVVYDTSTGNLYYDADGNGSASAQLVARLEGAPGLQASDIAVDNGSVISGGTSGDDSLVGGPAHDSLDGAGGNDTLIGNDGDDTLIGGTGNDRLVGNLGADSLQGGDGNDTLDGVAGNPEDENEEPDWDWVNNRPLPGGDTLDGGLGDDVYYLQVNDVISDAGGIDTVHTTEDYVLAAGLENLTWLWPPRSDGEGEHVEFSGNELDNIITIQGLYYESSSSVLDGGGGNDTLQGSGSITFKFSLGSGDYGHDVLYGGYNTTIDLADARSAFVANLSTGTLTGGGAGGSGSAELHGVDNVIGGAFDDHIIGGAGMGEDDLPARLEGREGNDTLEAGVWPTELDGGAANDRLISRGDDWMTGGTGADEFVFGRAPITRSEYYYGPTTTVRDFASGTDRIVLDGEFHAGVGSSGDFAAGDARFTANSSGTAQDASDRVVYNTSNGDLWYDADGSGAGGAQLITWLASAPPLLASDISVINGSAPAGELINGTGGADTLWGTAGDDTINGFDGNDLFVAGSTGGADVIDGGAGRDSIEFKERATSAIIVDFVSGTIVGGSSGTIDFTSIERVVTGNFNDTLTGNGAAQTLTGQAGSDTIWGAGGADTLWGGSGADTFVFREMGTANADRISDFASGSEKLQLDDAAFTAIGAMGNFAAADARFKANSSGTATDTNDRVVFNTSTGQLYYDADGSGSGAAAQLIATVQAGATVSATDIVVI